MVVVVVVVVKIHYCASYIYNYVYINKSLNLREKQFGAVMATHRKNWCDIVVSNDAEFFLFHN